MGSDILDELREWCVDWDGSNMVDGEPPRDGLHCDTLRRAADEIASLRARLAEVEGERDARIEAAVAAERERCAEVAENIQLCCQAGILRAVAEAIREQNHDE